MGNLEIELNGAGVRELLRSPEMLAICREHMENAAGKLGGGYEVNAFTGRNRVNAEIRAVTYNAKKENQKTNSILKAVLG